MNTDTKNTTFLLADDHSLIRQGLVFLLEDIKTGCNIVQASTLQQILDKLKSHPIDIAIMDVNFPDGNSLTIIDKIKELKPDIKILIYTGIDENPNALKFIKAGANGFLSKLSEEEEIKHAILKICNDGEYISPITQALLISSMRNPTSVNPMLKLSERELQIAKLYAEGLGNLEIASQLDIKQNTVSTTKKRIFDKLGIDNIVDLIEFMRND